MSENIKCMLYSTSNFIEGNLCNSNILQLVCQTYDELYNLKINFSYTLNSTSENLSCKNLPYIMYGDIKIERPNIHSFLKKFTNIDSHFNLDEANIDDDRLFDPI